MGTLTQFRCKCGKRETWIEAGKISDPCPNCGRKYKGKYSKRQASILVNEVK